MAYQDLLLLMQKSRLIMTDSGGIQEDASFLKKPVLILREVTERPEVVEAGFGRLVGTDSDRIVHAASRVLLDEQVYERMTQGENPFGDGFAATKIADFLEQELGLEAEQSKVEPSLTGQPA